MKLKYISIVLLAACVTLMYSACVKKDNYQTPNASLSGNIYQGNSSDLVEACTGSFAIRLEQLSWSDQPTPQDIPVKYDGTYRNSKLFSGHYRISIHGGAFWPVEPIEMDLGQGSTLDFNLTPYLLLKDFTAEMVDPTTLKLNFNLEAPAPGIPQIKEIQPYVNTTAIVGPGASIQDYSDDLKEAVNKEWADFTTEDKAREIIIPGLIPGRTFYVRAGVKLNNDDNSSNLSTVLKVSVPAEHTEAEQ